MIQALAALLPLIESLGASGVAAGSTAAATGSAAGTAATGTAAAGGLGASFSNIVNKVMGTVEGFKSPQQLGEGIQQAQQLADVIAGLKQSIGKTDDKQAEMIASAKARPGEVDPYTGARGEATPDRSQDPAHLQALAEIQQQRAALEKEAKAKNSQLVDLHARISQTTNPRSPIQTLGNLGGIAAGGGFLGQMFGLFGGGHSAQSDAQGGSQLAHQLANAPRNSLPGPLAGLANWIPGMKLGQNTAQAFLQPATDLGMNSAERNVAGGATQFGTDLASKALNPFAMMRGETMTHLAKLPGLLAEWGEGLVESKKHLMQFNGTLAQAFLEAERRGLIRNIESGQRTSGATAGLSDALQDLQDTVQPIKDTVTIVMSRGLEVLVRSVTEGVTILKTVYEIAKQMDARIAVAEAAIQMRGWGPIQAMPLDAFLKDVNKIDLTKPQSVERRR